MNNVEHVPQDIIRKKRDAQTLDKSEIDFNDLLSVAKCIQRRMVGENPRIAIILGSGLGSVAEQIEEPIVIPYSEIDGFPRGSTGR